MFLLGLLSLSLTTTSETRRLAPIDRQALVSRHNVVLTKFDSERPLQVGNGEFAFGMDLTGLQSFVPFNTMSQWGWHTSALPPGQKLDDFQGQVRDTHGRTVRYPMPDPKHPVLSDWMAGNPHRINLGRIGLSLKKRDGSRATQSDIKNAQQSLDLWSGIVTSRFELEGEPVTVTTACHPMVDAISAIIRSPLCGEGRLSVFFDCPGNDPRAFANYVGDWSQPGQFLERESRQPRRADFLRRIDNDEYGMSLGWQGDVSLKRPGQDPAPDLKVVKAQYGAGVKWLDVTAVATKAIHDGRLSLTAGNSLGEDPIVGTPKVLKVTYISGGRLETSSANENEILFIDPAPDRRRISLQPDATDRIAFTCVFSPKPFPIIVPNADATFVMSRRSWQTFWESGGAIDLSQSTDPRWRELERRIVLSQYLMKVNEAGSLPPQESGLVNNGWFGRFHMEMLWWHAAHWALWNRWSELNRSLSIYTKLLPGAKKLAASQGYLGARWPKCIGPDMREWPHEIHALLIWQQPHPIFFAELDYRAHPTRATLVKWQPIVDATADFLASYAYREPRTGRYVLGPPLFVVSENTDPKTTQNPTFELGYWRFGLRTAQLWRRRLGLPSPESWDRVLHGLAPLPKQHGLYVLHEGVKDMWMKWTFEHPALTGVFGMLPGDGVEKTTIRNTFDKVMKTWDFNHTWGWDFPMLAMCAARLGEPDRAIDLLLHSAQGFQFDDRGLATGGPFPYFPSNGGLLYAVAMMAAGWDGASATNAPGFPRGGRWKVRWENLSPAP